MSMRNKLLLVTSLALVSAASPADPQEFLRRGTAAFDRGEYVAALELFTHAEERAQDPGVVAYDKAACFYRLGRYRDAELHYRRCLEDAVGERRAGACYNLGNCLVQLAQGRDSRALIEAIRWYEECLKNAAPTSELYDDAGHNLE